MFESFEKNVLEDGIIAVLFRAIHTFNANENDIFLIKNDLSERCICARFACILSNELENTDYKEYYVDVEYNRYCDEYERNIKRMKNKPITVDLIVHKRGKNCNVFSDNLVCVEMKKSTDRRGCGDDKERLENMLDSEYGYCYKHALLILINMENSSLEAFAVMPRRAR